MAEFLAIVADTWRQSKQQVVFIIMGIVLALAVAICVILPKVFPESDRDPDNPAFGLLWSDEPVEFFEFAWIEQYANTLVVQEGKMENPFSEEGRQFQRAMEEARAEARRRAHDIPPFQRSVEAWASSAASIIYTLSMLLFIAACSSYYPSLLASGAVDVVLSKPLSRFRVFIAKYLGGMTLYTVAILITYMALFAGLGLRTGIWNMKLFLVIPMQIFSAAVIFALVGFLGVVFRSTALAMVVGLFFYLVIDSVVGTMQQLQQMRVMEDIAWIDKIVAGSRYAVPSFTYLKEAAVSSCLSIPHFDWVSIAVASAWLVLALGLGFLRFKRTDY